MAGVLSAMHTGVMGMNASGAELGVIGDNIANSETSGFKASRTEFQDVIATNLKGMMGGNQIGNGVRVGAVKSMFTQGILTSTDRDTDMAIEGDGFFVLEDHTGIRGFTRDGSFQFSKDGVLTTNSASVVQGFQADEKGRLTPTLGPIRIDKNVIPAVGTSKLTIKANLDVRSKIPAAPFNPKDPNDTVALSYGMTVLDSTGNEHLLTFHFENKGEGNWEWHAMADGKELRNGIDGEQMEVATGALQFDKEGRLFSEKTLFSQISFKGADELLNLDFDFGDSILDDGGTGLAGTTQYGSKSTVFNYRRDGNASGVLSSFSVADDGLVAGLYSNGETRVLGQIALAKFENNEGLIKTGRNQYREAPNSGAPLIGFPGENSRGVVHTRSLEKSNVDLATEFVKMISTQRAFQANSRTITTTDELLQEVMNLKR